MQITLNGKKHNTGEMTILELARQQGVKIPTMCYHREFGPAGRCRMCVVEADGKLAASCSTKLKEGMNILTDSEMVKKSRAITKRLIEYREKRMGQEESQEPIIRDNSRCISCKACVKVCETIQNVNAITDIRRGRKTKVSTPFELGFSNSPCTFCGQCTLLCDRDAVTERNDVQYVMSLLKDKKKHVIVQTAPSVRASLGEMFGMQGELVTGKMAAALRKLGFYRVFDTDFAADVTTYEETHEFLERLEKNKLPHLTSCCPAWIRFAEYYYPEFLEKISTTKSPHMMMGSLIKTQYARKECLDPKNIIVVSIMPCTAKKFEITRPETKMNGMNNVDVVLTVRELGELLKLNKIDLKKMNDEEFDSPLGISSGGAAIYGVTGGVTENVLRSASYMINGEQGKIEFKCVRGFDGIKEAKLRLGDRDVSLAVVSGLGNIRKLLELMKDGKKYDIVELMACPGGCINGGGQPKSCDNDIINKRANALFDQDKKLMMRVANKNPGLKEVYEFLEKPLSKKSKEILHTAYKKRETILKKTKSKK
jgi:NADP-reducing hydrogenase subunit HndD